MGIKKNICFTLVKPGCNNLYVLLIKWNPLIVTNLMANLNHVRYGLKLLLSIITFAFKLQTEKKFTFIKMKNNLLIFLLIAFTMPLFSYGQSVVEPISSKRFVEFGPAISGDGKTMVFQVMRKNRWYLYESFYNGDSWSEPQPLESINRKFEYIAGPSLSYNGLTLYFTAYQEDSEMAVSSEDIFISQKVGGVWMDPQNLGKPVNSFMYEGFPSISADGNTIYFMRDNKDNPFDEEVKVHCFKLYKAQKDMFGNWHEPEELPYPVNFNCERSPKIMIDNQTLMYSSVRGGGSGKFDIYVSKLLDNNMWTEPVALDYLNTDENDQSPCISVDGSKIYFYTNEDIYVSEIPEELREFDKVKLKGQVIDAVFNLGLSVNIQIVNPFSGQVISDLDNTESDGNFTTQLNKGIVYDFNIIQDNNYTYTFPLDLRNLGNAKEVERTFELFSNLNLKMEVVDSQSNEIIPTDKRILIQMDKTPREDIYLLKILIENYAEASTFFDLKEIRKNPDYSRRIEVDPL